MEIISDLSHLFEILGRESMCGACVGVRTLGGKLIVINERGTDEAIGAIFSEKNCWSMSERGRVIG